jgi:hypothetical protein
MEAAAATRSPEMPSGQGLGAWTTMVFDNLELRAGVIPVTSDAGVMLNLTVATDHQSVKRGTEAVTRCLQCSSTAITR